MYLDQFIKVAAWLSLCAIIFVTISPIGLRPRDVLPVDADRALSFTVVAMLFVTAYPKRFWLCALLLICGAAAMELLQLLSHTRHARLQDASVKAIGAAVGVCVGYGINKARQIVKEARLDT